MRSVALLLAAVACASGFYLPGMGKISYSEGAKIDVEADRLQSLKVQFPYDYYKLPFCEPADGHTKRQHLNLGEILMGERHEITNIDIRMLVNEECVLQCTQTLTAAQIKQFKEKVKDEYFVYLNADNMPVIMDFIDEGKTFKLRGLPLGRYDKANDVVELFNHYDLVIQYHIAKTSATNLQVEQSSEDPSYRVIAFKGTVDSRGYKPMTESGNQCPDKSGTKLVLGSEPSGQQVSFSYSVRFEETTVEWSTRWDTLLEPRPDLRRVQWFSIINSIAITIFLTAIVALVLFRTVYLDFARYNEIDDTVEAQEETGWKQVHSDVFRPPMATGLLCVFLGIGAQLYVIVIITLFFSILGFFSPSYRGGLLTALVLFWTCTGVIAGYVSARTYSGLKGTNTRLVALGSCFGFSGVVFSIFFLINLELWMVGSTAAVSFWTLSLLLIVWLLIAVPLNFLGSLFGAKADSYNFPTKTATFHRPIPEGADANSILFILTGGLLPFACVFIELTFIMDSLWEDDIFYMFGFLFVVFIILAITCAEVSVVISYFFLSNEDYHWWWRSFLTPATSGAYVFIYSIIFLNTQHDLKGMHFASVIMYLAYMFIISASFAFLTGFIGFESSFLFISKMFSSVKID
eukprot:Plantae.Rhodophyta-Purpureofilum_apyrenoidigerum.ctg23189.p1 GENE.Plantae.Rhodophyta-Purpureofilum_apyrenoidigerum.ctg23189~~Plantae.Rhodophyta-Purpureofilum_apyrenoidigerum.ctg23189.p1  ORF type:complete len:632 (+),score=148.71 Plantae.Rhodophyta-Purpureofilum_apyrenoidigerum.ctg23189:108-2003(+)